MISVGPNPTGATIFMIMDEEFVGLLNASERGVSEIANALSVSLPTVRRWKAGTNLPHQAMRSAAVKWLKENSSLGDGAIGSAGDSESQGSRFKS